MDECGGDRQKSWTSTSWEVWQLGGGDLLVMFTKMESYAEKHVWRRV